VNKLLLSSLTADYKTKCGLLYISFAKNCKIPYKILEYKKEQIPTRVEGWPKTRINYVTAQGGFFMDWINCDDDTIVIHTDADMILQRWFIGNELEFLEVGHDEIAGCSCHWPSQTLGQAAKNIMPKDIQFKGYENMIEFAGGFMIATAKTLRKFKKLYIENHDDLVKSFDRLGANQWLINYITHKYFKFKLLPEYVMNAIWYTGTNARMINGSLCTIVNNQSHIGKKVIFNHYKFIQIKGGYKY